MTVGGAGPIRLEAWVDASHREEGESRAQLGIALRLNAESGMFLCRSLRDIHVSFSISEAELRAFTLATFEVLWARYLLEEIGLLIPSYILYCLSFCPPHNVHENLFIEVFDIG